MAVIETDVEMATRLSSVIQDARTVVYGSLDELLEAGASQAPTLVIILGPSQEDEVVLDRMGSMIKSRPGLGAVLVVARSTTAVLRMALRAGIDDALPIGQIESELESVVRELGFRLKSETAGIGPKEVANAPSPRLGRVTTLFSPKGGVGKTVVAVNVAAALARISPEPVVLVDLDFQFGDVAVMLRMPPSRNILDVAVAGDRLDPSFLQGLLIRDEQTGVLVLPAPGEPAARDITIRTISGLFATLRDMGMHVIVDTPTGLNELVLDVVAESDDIVFLVGMDVPSVKNARLGLQAFEVLEIPLDRLVVVLNRADSKVNLAVRDVERTLQLKVDVSLPSDALVPQSVNQGTPAVIAHRRSRFAGAIEQLAQTLRSRAVSTHG
ncbi:MAG TPA: AAA family ATPase [Acidimicrobiales bacterium]|nr:AAA family ATPase [Acidimicrobiales bacterium]